MATWLMAAPCGQLNVVMNDDPTRFGKLQAKKTHASAWVGVITGMLQSSVVSHPSIPLG